MAGAAVPARLRSGHARCAGAVEAPSLRWPADHVPRRLIRPGQRRGPMRRQARHSMSRVCVRSAVPAVAFGVPRGTPCGQPNPKWQTALDRVAAAVGQPDATRLPIAVGRASPIRPGSVGPWRERRTRQQLGRRSLRVRGPAGSCGRRSLRARDLAGPVPRETTPTLVDQDACASQPASSDRQTRLAASATPRPLWTSGGEVVAKSAGRPGVHPVSAAKDRALEAAGRCERHIHQDLAPWPTSRCSGEAQDCGRRPRSGARSR